ncbi:hypothetical protein QYF50_18910 [Paenibacillus vini]|uniref:hypothetical protein n=1 Tax=Paenibacillus vini TaxID=1476024 RepID=UPI0025B6D27F|nr:hypothetical protein [Paenibacillus vini]MDN4069977.1 hypothetical protein [Paenibacillus vini]
MLNQAIRRKVDENFADILLAKQMGIRFSDDEKFIIFSSGVVRDEFDRRRRERKRENERVCEGVSGDSGTTDGHKERIRQTTSYNFNRVPRRPAR